MKLLWGVRLALLGVASSILGVQGMVNAGPLNDTGIDTVGRHGMSVGDDMGSGEVLPHGGQDAGYGRDAAAQKGVLPKVGGSARTVSGRINGFDFTKISSSGKALPATAQLGPEPGDWACTYDNTTGLMWEVKVNEASHLRHMGHTYAPVLRRRRDTNMQPITPGVAKRGLL